MYAPEVKGASTAEHGIPARDLLVVLGLSTLALVLRLLVAERGGLWRDEALFLFVVRSESWRSMLDFLKLHESHPPLFYAVMRLWLSAFEDSDASAVVLPVTFGVILVPTLYFVGASLFSRRLGLLAAALGALSPALTEYSAEAHARYESFRAFLFAPSR